MVPAAPGPRCTSDERQQRTASLLPKILRIPTEHLVSTVTESATLTCCRVIADKANVGAAASEGFVKAPEQLQQRLWALPRHEVPYARWRIADWLCNR